MITEELLIIVVDDYVQYYDWWVLTSKNVGLPAEKFDFWGYSEPDAKYAWRKCDIGATNRMWFVSKNMLPKKGWPPRPEWIWNNSEIEKTIVTRFHPSYLEPKHDTKSARTEGAGAWSSGWHSQKVTGLPGGAIIRPKPPVFDRSWRSPSKNTVKKSTEDTCSWTRPSKIGKWKVKKKPCFSTF